MEQEALYGTRPVIDRWKGVQVSMSGITLVIRQANAEIALDEQCSIRISRPARVAGGRAHAAPGITSLIEEDVRDRVADASHYAGWLLDYVDPTRRLSRVALACCLDGVGYMPWRTRQEAAASPDRANIGLSGWTGREARPLSCPAPRLSSTSRSRPRTSPCGCGGRRTGNRRAQSCSWKRLLAPDWPQARDNHRPSLLSAALVTTPGSVHLRQARRARPAPSCPCCWPGRTARRCRHPRRTPARRGLRPGWRSARSA
jgi:hypothetical protein